MGDPGPRARPGRRGLTGGLAVPRNRGYDAGMTSRLRLAQALAAGACALALVAGGCGDDDEESGGGSTAAAPTATGGAAAAAADGKAVFESNCASCHTLEASEANGSFGPNLDELKPDAATVANKVENGGGGMPSFEGQLSAEEIQAVADYVAENAGT